MLLLHRGGTSRDKISRRFRPQDRSMKRKLATLTAILATAISLEAQTAHLRFKGVDVDGTSSAFNEALRQKGFTLSRGGMADGIFAGNHVTVVTETTPLSRTVCSVNAQLDSRGTWKELKSDYEGYKNNLTDKYGEPSSVEERFTGAYRDGDGYELKAIQLEKCIWASIWDIPEGRITISLVNGNRGCCLQITYSDKANSLLGVKEMNDIYKEDL